MSWVQSIKEWAKRLKTNYYALVCLKASSNAVVTQNYCCVAVAYAFSPIDLIPDFIPILGFIDDAVILPILIWLAVRFTPQQVILMLNNKLKNG